MQCLIFRGAKHEKQGYSKRSQAANKPVKRLFESNTRAIFTRYLQSPCMHSKGLSTMAPEPVKEEKRNNDQEQIVTPMLNTLAVI